MNDADGWFSAGRALLHANRDDEALEHIEKGLGCDAQSEWGHRLRSIALSALGRDVQALEAAEKAVAIRPQLWRGRTRIARCYVALDRLGDADEALKKAAALNPEGSTIYTQWARVAWLRDQPERAESLARKAVTLDPVSVDALRQLGSILSQIRPSKDLEAFGFYAQAMALDPTRADVRKGVVDAGFNVLVVPPTIVAVITGVPLVGSVCASFGWPGGWCLVMLFAVVWVRMTAATYRRQKRKLEEVRPGGADLFWKLRRAK